ncbi:ribonuclease H-like domain-containing protein [bacterium]|nr:ribonuclease H-like domain-containing protein [bacterium]
MLEKTFVHIPGVGYTTERRLWERGIRSWGDALGHVGTPGAFSAARWGLVQDHCRQSIGSLQGGDHRYFAQMLAARDHWRACEHFRSKVGYLDIETDGGFYADAITVIGIYDGMRVKSFVRGENLEDFAEELERYALLVTFNGATFDVPFLKRAFPRAPWDQLHVDLRYMLAKLGYRGGLKQIEREVGLARDEDIAGLAGDDAIVLWQQYRRGSSEALDLLLRYNAADVENLERLLDLAYPRLQAHTESCPEP